MTSFTNLTRDPHHQNSDVTYIRNMSDMVVTIDGEPVDSKRICSIIRRPIAIPVNPEPKAYIKMLINDEAGKVAVDGNGRPITENIYGTITVEGVPNNTGCTPCRARRAGKWWEKIDDPKGDW